MTARTGEKQRGRRQAVSDHKRTLILDAAREIFAQEGLEGASLRAIALRAGYTPAALYFHFDSKEAIYAELLRISLAMLRESVETAVTRAPDSAQAKLHAAAMAFFDFYAANPHDLDLGFYLLRGGMKPRGLGRQRNQTLNETLAAALRPVGDAATDLGVPAEEASLLIADVFAHATGLLLLLHTGRIRMFGASAAALMEGYLQDRLERITERFPS